MTLSVLGKHAIITGGGSGINLAFAKKLLSRGCSVLIGDLGLRPEARELLKQYPHEPSRPPSGSRPVALFKKTDVRSWPQLSELTRAAEATFPQVDIVVPGAGIYDPKWSSFWEPPKSATNPDSPSRDNADGDPGHYAVLDVNLTHPIRLSQLAIAHWTSRRIPGSLLLVGSMAGYLHGIGTPLYFASKHGVHAFVRSLGHLRDTVGIRTAAIAPGAVNTPLLTDDPEKRSMFRPDLAASAEEIADAMLELIENPQYGDGTIFEATNKGTRVVPAFNAPVPDLDIGAIAEYQAEMERRWTRMITEKGLKLAINNGPLANFGNFVNRIVKFVNAKLDGVVPEFSPSYKDDNFNFPAWVETVNGLLKKYMYVTLLEKVHISAGVETFVEIRRKGNNLLKGLLDINDTL